MMNPNSVVSKNFLVRLKNIQLQISAHLCRWWPARLCMGCRSLFACSSFAGVCALAINQDPLPPSVCPHSYFLLFKETVFLPNLLNSGELNWFENITSFKKFCIAELPYKYSAQTQTFSSMTDGVQRLAVPSAKTLPMFTAGGGVCIPITVPQETGSYRSL